MPKPFSPLPTIDRRTLLQVLAASSTGVIAAGAVLHGGAHGAAATDKDGGSFSWSWLVDHAEDLAKTPYSPPEPIRHPALDMTYDQYRSIHYRRDRAVWADANAPFQLELFHPGYLYTYPITVHAVEAGRARRLRYRPADFRFDPPAKAPPADLDAGLAGFRVLGAINDTQRLDEFLVFQGASYFRSHARGQTYGLSARGLALDTAQPRGEEFPTFRTFWVEKPARSADSVVVYALLDGPSAAGAYQFRTRFSDATVTDVELVLFPRRVLDYAGIGCLTSMYFVGPAGHTRHDDFRPRVHDSEGLSVWNGAGEWLWRPIVNPRAIQYSSFVDDNPRGFGLIQRNRNVADYQDFIVQSNVRPSAWIEPLDGWGRGAVVLTELPTANEYMDNIVAFWKPDAALQPGRPHRYRYRLHWSGDVPTPFAPANPFAKVIQVRTGQGIERPWRLILIDCAGGMLDDGPDAETPGLVASADAPVVLGSHAFGRNPVNGGWRLAIMFDPKGATSADLRFHFTQRGQQVTEICIYRYGPA